MAWTEKLMIQVELVDSATKPLQHIEQHISQLRSKSAASWATMTGGAAAVESSVMAIQATLAPAIEMDRALAEVASLSVHQETLKALGRTALDFSAEYGRSATDFVHASYDIQSAIAGLEGNELPSFARASGVLAMAAKADTSTITNYMGTMYGIFEQQAKQMGKTNWVEDVAGKTALAVQLFKTTGQGMADAFGTIGANATAAGVSMDEQFAVLGRLQSTMGGGEAGTKFKAFLAGVGGAQTALGMQFTDSAGNMLPVLTILDKLKAKYGETLSVAEGDELRKAFGSDEAVDMVKLLMTNTEALSSDINALANTHGMGKAEQMAATMTDQWERMTQAWFAIRAAAFSAVLPAINAVVGVFADGATTVLHWTHLFPNLTKVVGYALLAIKGLSMVAGTWMLLTGLANLTTLGLGIAWSVIMAPLNLLKAGLVTFRAILLAVNIAMYANPIGLIVMGIVLLIGAVAAVIYYWDDLKKTLADWGVFDAIQEMIDGAAAGWASFMQQLGDLSPFQLLGRAVDWLIEKLNMIPGVNIELGSLPELQMPTIPPQTLPVMPGTVTAPMAAEQQQASLTTPLAHYRQQNQSKVPTGGLGQQLIQANAAATATTQRSSRSINTGDVHMHVQNPLSPEQLEKELWMTTRG